jgi:uncharacterized repeat protein (TIGR01451 family)
VKTQRTRFGHWLPLFFLPLITLSNASDVYARGVVLDCATNLIDPRQPEDCPYAWNAQLTFNFAQADSSTVALDFPLRIGNDSIASLVINRNGFVSFEPIDFVPSLVSLADLGTDVVAPFYSPIEFTFDEVTIGFGQLYDLPDDLDDPVIPFGPTVAYRVTWGTVDGVSMLEGPPDVTNKFQLIIIDRSDIAEGDFDLQMNYGPVNWESPPAPPSLSGTSTLVGLVLGETVVDFNRYYDSFLSNGLCEDPGKITTPGSFAVTEPFVCNNITLEFRDGLGTMAGFTSDLDLAAVANTDSVNAGEEVELTFTIDNIGPDDSSNTNLVVGIPSGTTVVAKDPDDGTCTDAGEQLACALGEVAASESRIVSLTVRAETAGQFDFSSEVAADQLDPGLANNSATVSVSADPSADLNVVASVSPMTVTVSDTTDLSLTVTNDGPSDASNVHLVATLPSGTSLDEAANLEACTETELGLDCDLGALPNGTTTAMVIPLIADDSGTFSLVATVEADEHDPNSDDNRAEVALEANGVSDIELAIDSPEQSISQGETLNLTLTVTNAGPQDASAVTVDVALPAFLAFNSGDTCSASGAQITCTQGELAQGDSATIQLVLSATSAGSGTISVEASAAEEDPASDNNSQAFDLSVTESSDSGGGGGGAIDPSALVALLLLRFYRAKEKQWLFRKYTGRDPSDFF